MSMLNSFSDLMQDRKNRGQQAASAEKKSVRLKIETRNLSFFYGPHQALFDVSLEIAERMVMALIGPSGCGKSTFLRTLNRMNEIIEGTRLTGEVLLEGQNIYAPSIDVVALRKRVGMVFQKSTPFPKSIFDNVAYGPRIAGLKNRKQLGEVVEQSLRRAAAAAVHYPGTGHQYRCAADG